MSDTTFQFSIYRLNTVDEFGGLFDGEPRTFTGDKDLLAVLEAATDSDFDLERESERSQFKWAVRSYSLIDEVAVVQLGKATLSAVTATLSDESIEVKRSAFNPPTTDYVHLIFFMRRHIVAVEYLSALTSTEAWRAAFQEIFYNASRSLKYNSHIQLEPIPGKDNVMSVFRSFDKLTKFTVQLRLPNPEVSRSARDLMNRMQSGGIREWHQRMFNPKGLSTQQGEIPYSSAELAEAGYKDGDVRLEGTANGKRVTKRIGNKAIRSEAGLRDFVREKLNEARSKEAQRCLKEISDEIDRISPPPDNEKPKFADRKSVPKKKPKK